MTSAQRAWAAVGISVLVALGYGAAADLRVSAALVGLALLVAGGALAYQRPRAALSVSVLLILIAGTKFRRREATDSLEGSLDAQILFEIAMFATVAVALLAWWMTASDRRRPTRVEMLLGVYGGIALLSTLWSAAPLLTLVRATQLLIVAALAMACVRTMTPKGALWTACGSVAIYAVACSILGPTFPWVAEFADAEYRNRFAWFSVHPIAVGTTTAMAALGLVTTAFWTPPRCPARVLGVPLPFYALPLFVILLATNSRGPLLAFVAGVGVLAFLRCGLAVRVPLVLTTVAILLVMLASGHGVEALVSTVAAQDSAVSRLLLQQQTVDDLVALNGRLNLWAEARPLMAEHFWLGQGFQASRASMLAIADWAGYAHNALLQSVLDLGILGTAALLAIVIAGLSQTFRPPVVPWARGASAALLIFLVLMSISMEMFAGAPGFETLLFFICVLVATSRDDPAETRR